MRLVVVTLLVACGCQRAPASPPTVARTPTPLDTATTGMISGRVLFEGEVPPPRPVPQIVSDPACVAAHPAGLTITDVQELDGQLADVFVYIAHGLEDRVFAVPDQPVLVDQHDCLYTPRVIGAQVGQQIVFLNSDDTLHNVHGEPTASAPWNFGLGLQGARRTITIDHAEVPVPVRCDVHPWMQASIGVVAHPYHAVTNATGTFGLSDLPAGHYVVAAWHPTLGTLQAEVDITAGDALEIELVFTPQKDGK